MNPCQELKKIKGVFIIDRLKDISLKIFDVIKNILIIVGAIFGVFFVLGKIGSKNVYEKALKEKIKNNEEIIKEKENHVDNLKQEDKILEEKNKEITNKINIIKKDMEEKEELFRKQREEIEKSKNDTNDNIDYINKRYQ